MTGRVFHFASGNAVSGSEEDRGDIETAHHHGGRKLQLSSREVNGRSRLSASLRSTDAAEGAVWVMATGPATANARQQVSHD